MRKAKRLLAMLMIFVIMITNCTIAILANTLDIDYKFEYKDALKADATSLSITDDYTSDYTLVQAEMIDKITIVKAGSKNGYIVQSDGEYWTYGLGEGSSKINKDDIEIVNTFENVMLVKSPSNTAVYLIKQDGSLYVRGTSDSDTLKSDIALLTKDCTYAIEDDGTLWSFNIDNSSGKKRIVPIHVIDDVSTLVGTDSSTYALKNDKTLWTICDNEIDEMESNVQILSDVDEVVPNGSSVYALKSDDTLWAWKDTQNNQADDIVAKAKSPPEKILENVNNVIVSGHTSYALKNDKTLWAWSDSSDIDYETLEPIKVLENVKQIVANDQILYAIKDDKTLWAFSNTKDNDLPTPIEVLKDVEQVIPMDYAINNLDDDNLDSIMNAFKDEMGYDYIPTESINSLTVVTTSGEISSRMQLTPISIIINGELQPFKLYMNAYNECLRASDIISIIEKMSTQGSFGVDLNTDITYSEIAKETQQNGIFSGKHVNSKSLFNIGDAKFLLYSYIINGNSYFKLRYLPKASDFSNDWNSVAKTMKLLPDEEHNRVQLE